MRGKIAMEDNIRTEIINSIINGDIDHASELVETHKPGIFI